VDWHPTPAPRRTDCHYCAQPVIWLPTYIDGHALCFDADPVERRRDRERQGWAPGAFPIASQLRTVHAPVRVYPSYQRDRFNQVMLLHRCAAQTCAQVVAA
jgi:hypothetical protein